MQTIDDKFRLSSERDLDFIVRAISTGLSGGGSIVEEYEAALLSRFRRRFAVALSSGTAALQVALWAVGVGQGSRVVVTPTCPLCTVYAILGLGAEPVFCDTQSNAFACDLDDLAFLMEPRPDAVIDIPMWGYPTDVSKLHAFTAERGIPLILDLAHAHGTRLGTDCLSTHCEIACFSTHERKLVSTGEGGFVLTDHEALARRCRDYSRFGNLLGDSVGLNFKISGLQAAIGLNRVGLLDEQLRIRRQNAEQFIQRLDSSKACPFPIPAGGKPNYYTQLIKLDYSDNGEFLAHLSRNGIPSDVVRYGVRCLYRFPVLSQFSRDCPKADALLHSITTIPVHPGVTEDQIEYMADVVNAYSE